MSTVFFNVIIKPDFSFGDRNYHMKIVESSMGVSPSEGKMSRDEL